MTQETENPTRRSRHQKVGRLESNLGDATEGWVVGGGLWVVLNLNHNLNPNRYRRGASGDGGSKSLSTKNGIDPDSDFDLSTRKLCM